MVGADVLVEGGFGFEGYPACVVAVPVLEVFVLGGLQSVGGADVSGLMFVDSANVDGEVVLAVEGAVAVWFRTWVLGLLGGITMYCLEMGPEVDVALEPLATLCALWWVTFSHMGVKLSLGCEGEYRSWSVGCVAGIRLEHFRLGSWFSTYHAEQRVLLSSLVDLVYMPLEGALGLIAMGTLVACVGVDKGARVWLYLQVLHLDMCQQSLLLPEHLVARWIVGAIELGLMDIPVPL